ncbi:MAG: hypothetical protein J6P72_09795 [Firmicutes bacterium]|nr:hypothetical protein [Bacillota bacterium]
MWKPVPFEVFTDYAKDQIKYYLGDDYQDAEVEIKEVKKLSRTYMGMTVNNFKSNMLPTVDLNLFYDMYKKDQQNLNDSVRDMADLIKEHSPAVFMDEIWDYDYAKEQLFFRINNYRKNREMLQNAPFVTVEDLAITFHVRLSIPGQGLGSIMITNELMEEYGVTQDELYQQATYNTPRLFPPRLELVEDILEELTHSGKSQKDQNTQQSAAEELEDSDIIQTASDEHTEISEVGKSAANNVEEDVDLQLFKAIHVPHENLGLMVLTNQSGIGGASALFYEGMMDKLASILEEDYYVLPSSVHEVLIAKVSKSPDVSVLKKMVREINTQEVQRRDRLSDQVYRYDRHLHRLLRT